MTAFESGTAVRTLLELLADDDSIVPVGTTGHVLGFEGDRVIVVFSDGDTGEPVTFTAAPWELLRVRVA